MLFSVSSVGQEQGASFSIDSRMVRSHDAAPRPAGGALGGQGRAGRAGRLAASPLVAPQAQQAGGQGWAGSRLAASGQHGLPRLPRLPRLRQQQAAGSRQQAAGTGPGWNTVLGGDEAGVRAGSAAGWQHLRRMGPLVPGQLWSGPVVRAWGRPGQPLSIWGQAGRLLQVASLASGSPVVLRRRWGPGSWAGRWWRRA